MKKLLLGLFCLTIFIEIIAQNSEPIELNGQLLSLDSIRSDQTKSYRFVIKMDEANKSQNTRSYREANVRKSDNNKFVAFASTDIIEYLDNFEREIKNPYFGIYNNRGDLLFTDTLNGFYAAQFYLSSDGKFFHIIWGSLAQESSNIYSKLISYDYNGKRISKIDNVTYIYSGADFSSFFYLKDFSFTGNKTNLYTIFFKDIIRNINWDKTFVTDFQVTINAISYDGKKIICLADKVYSIDYTGKILWANDNRDGIFRMSENGKYVSQIPTPGTFYLLDNETGKILLDLEYKDLQKFRPVETCFISTASQSVIALFSFSESKKKEIVIIDTEGKILSTYNVDEGIAVSRIDGKIEDDKLQIFLNDELYFNIKIPW
jgi:hypothetical protein